MIVRELFARLGIKEDSASFEKADQSISKLKTGLKALGAILVTGAVAHGMQSLVEDASDAAETTNVLTEAFGENKQAVLDWSDTTAIAMGRSRFELREMAGSLGAMLEPMIDSKKEAAEMSTTLSGLAVDLASFFNATDPEAIAALKSGIVGMSMPLRRFGIVMLDATLEEFARAKGIRKSLTEMSNAEKVQLRYQFILEKSTTAQGDAARTSEQYANATKALSSALRDLGTMVGQALLPGAERMVLFFRDSVRGIEELLRGTKFLQVALAALGVVATIVGVQMLLPFLPAIVAATALAAAFGLVVAVIEDIWVFFRGGKSLIGRVLEGWGVDTDALRESFEKLWDSARRVFTAIGEKAREVASKLQPHFGKAFDAIGEAAGKLIVWLSAKFIEFADKIGPMIDSLLEFDIEGAVDRVSEFFSEFGTKIQTFLNSRTGKILIALLGAYLGRKAGAATGEAVGSALGTLAGKTRIPGSAAVGKFLGEKTGGLLGSLAGVIAGGGAGLKFAEGIQPRQGAGTSLVNAPTNNIDVTVQAAPGQSAESLGESIANVIDQRLGEKSKAALRVLVPGAGLVL